MLCSVSISRKIEIKLFLSASIDFITKAGSKSTAIVLNSIRQLSTMELNWKMVFLLNDGRWTSCAKGSLVARHFLTLASTQQSCPWMVPKLWGMPSIWTSFLPNSLKENFCVCNGEMYMAWPKVQFKCMPNICTTHKSSLVPLPLWLLMEFFTYQLPQPKITTAHLLLAHNFTTWKLKLIMLT